MHGTTKIKLPLSCADCLEFREPQLPEALRTSSGLYKDSFDIIPPNCVLNLRYLSGFGKILFLYVNPYHGELYYERTVKECIGL